ncbi:MAG: hypothetical protein RLO51_11065 [Thalassobaculum sp.]|uniref:hypothetical protein n=1 Tax=Thalassobaculum sp. TaxID=2022740 RepID=UPI0032EC172B
MVLRHRRRLRPATPDQQSQLHAALTALQTARDKIRGADCPNTLKKIRRALKSAEGAERHMRRRVAAGP